MKNDGKKVKRTISIKRVRTGIRAGNGQGYECDNHFGSCGTPAQSGGGGGSGCGGGSILPAD